MARKKGCKNLKPAKTGKRLFCQKCGKKRYEVDLTYTLYGNRICKICP